MDRKLGGLIEDLKALTPRAKGLIAIVGGLAALSVVSAIIEAVRPPPPPAPAQAQAKAAASAVPARSADSDDDLLSQMACTAAQREVLKALKAPATADFPNCAFSAHEYKITANPERTKIGVQGFVDSQNSYGAQVRSRFVVLFNKAPGSSVSSFSAYEVAVE